METQELIFYGRTILLPLFMLCGAIAMFVKLRGTISGVLGGLGFVMMFGIWGLYSLTSHEVFYLREWPESARYALVFGQWIAWALIVVALFAIPRARAGRNVVARSGVSRNTIAEGPDFEAVSDFASHATPHGLGDGVRPGWGLATGWIVCSTLVFLAGLVYLAMWMDAGPRVSNREMREIMPVLVVMLLLLIPTTILYCMWLYQSWKAVPPEFRSATPGQAVGFLFIPLFNLYWVFRAVPGLSRSTLRATASVAPEEASGGGYGMGIAAAVVSIIPYVNMLSWIFFLIWVILANTEKNRMLRVLSP